MNKRVTTDQFIERAILKHGDVYSYAKTNYVKANEYVTIICEKHGEFNQMPFYHLDGNGCPKCGKLKIGNGRRLNNNLFIEKAKIVHSDKYDYNNVIYKHTDKRVLINCRKHGFFEQTPHHHLSGKGCPICKVSKGEELIRKFLILNQISFEMQKKFDSCKNKRTLPFDFYLPNENLLIEFDGKQHFMPIKKFEMKKTFERTVFNDKIKNKFAFDSEINLLRISYRDINKIEIILKNKLLK